MRYYVFLLLSIGFIFLSDWQNLFAVPLDLGFLFSVTDYKLNIIFFLAIFNVCAVLLNAYPAEKNKKDFSLSKKLFLNQSEDKRIILTILLFLSSVFLLFSTYLLLSLLFFTLIFFISFFYSATEEKIIYKNNKALKKLSDSFLQEISTLFFVFFGILFYFLGTHTFSIAEFNIENQVFFHLAIILFFAAFCYEAGIFPFFAQISKTLHFYTKGNLFSIFMIKKISILCFLGILIKVLLLECENSFLNTFELVSNILLIISLLVGSLTILFKHSAHAFCSGIIISFSAFLPSILWFFDFPTLINLFPLVLIATYLPVLGLYLLFRGLLTQNESEDDLNILSGLAGKNKKQAFLITVFILSIAGVPLTSGFTLRYELLYQFFSKELYLYILSFCILSILVFAYFILLVRDMFSMEGTSSYRIFRHQGNIEMLFYYIIIVMIIFLSFGPFSAMVLAT